MLGANIGTCGTACLAAIGKKTETIRVAWAYLLFKLIGVALTVAFIQQFTDLVLDTTMSAEAAAQLRADQYLGAVVPKFLANCHTVFNVLLALLCLPFTSPLADFVVWSLHAGLGLGDDAADEQQENEAQQASNPLPPPAAAQKQRPTPRKRPSKSKAASRSPSRSPSRSAKKKSDESDAAIAAILAARQQN
jgi:hypothetical protein